MNFCKCCLQRFLAVHKLSAPLLCLSVAFSPDLLLLLNQSIIRPILLYCCVCFLKCMTHSAIIDHKTFQSSLFVRLFVSLTKRVFVRREKPRDCQFPQAIPKVFGPGQTVLDNGMKVRVKLLPPGSTGSEDIWFAVFNCNRQNVPPVTSKVYNIFYRPFSGGCVKYISNNHRQVRLKMLSTIAKRIQKLPCGYKSRSGGFFKRL